MHKKCRKPKSTWRSYHSPCCKKVLWPPDLSWSHKVLSLNFQSWLSMCVQVGGCTHNLSCRGKAAHRTCGAGEPSQWEALGMLSSPVTPKDPRHRAAWQALICLKEKNLLCHELSLFQHLRQYLCLWEKGKPVNISTAVGILARQHIYSIKEGEFQTVLYCTSQNTACYPEFPTFPS